MPFPKSTQPAARHGDAGESAFDVGHSCHPRTACGCSCSVCPGTTDLLPRRAFKRDARTVVRARRRAKVTLGALAGNSLGTPLEAMKSRQFLYSYSEALLPSVYGRDAPL